MTEKIAYEKHPVTPERKAQLRAQGFTIVDARFKPADGNDADGHEPVDGVKDNLVNEPAQQVNRPGRPPKAK